MYYSDGCVDGLLYKYKQENNVNPKMMTFPKDYITSYQMTNAIEICRKLKDNYGR